ncbi:MAG: magnesium transporter [Acidimicrobiales bacterium]
MPAAVGLRGNVFGPLGGRLSTALRTGTFSWTWRRDSVLGQNLIASLTASFVAGLGLALVASVVALSVSSGGVAPIGVADYIVVSMLGGILASAWFLVSRSD